MISQLDRYASAANKNIAPWEYIFSMTKILNPGEIKMVLKYTADISVLPLILFNPKTPRSIRLKDGTVYDYRSIQRWLEKLADMQLRDMNIVGGAENRVAYRYGRKWLRFAGSSIEYSRRFHEIFVTEPYKMLDCKSRDVIDIGANIGDTAIYFATRGARRVYGYEPYPYTYNLAKRNVALNKLGGRIRMFNEGCSGKSFTLVVNPNLDNHGSSPVMGFKKGVKVGMHTLEELVKRHGIKDGALKMDCEGWEYDIIFNTDDKTLRKFHNMAIEYHYGYKALASKLEGAGFRVSHTSPSYVPKNMVEPNSRQCGLLYAVRKN
jgi:FkbM family methyltransferase